MWVAARKRCWDLVSRRPDVFVPADSMVGRTDESEATVAVTLGVFGCMLRLRVGGAAGSTTAHPASGSTLFDLGGLVPQDLK